MSSFKVEVKTSSADSWNSNALRFASPEAAEAYAWDLVGRWLAVSEWQVVESAEEANR